MSQTISSTKPLSIEKGSVGEERLTTWFQRNRLGFIPVSQSPLTFPSIFTGRIKRPDFLVILESMGMLAVDAKNYACSNECFTLNLEELRRALAFEWYTRLPFWFAYLQEEEQGEVWYWISAMRALNSGEVRVNGRTGDQFGVIPKRLFVQIEKIGDLGHLINQTQRLHNITLTPNLIHQP
ncbi:MAG TPA: hypothetical protein DCX54_10880 [Flavobacteriales bacterium]|nr:hypothetical protein [Flavobacteriales bacterium]